jgi:SAM-dependent methyltransferase
MDKAAPRAATIPRAGLMAMTVDGGNQSWMRFWDTEPSIYVSPRHLDSHYNHIANDILRVLPGRQPRVLDHGCGEALHAGRVASACSALYLCDAAPKLRARLAERFATDPRIKVIAPEAVEELPEGSLDLVVANSLVQYLTPAALGQLVATWHRMLKPGGRLIIADVITPQQTALADAAALLRFAARSGFLLDAALGLIRTFFSDYRRLRTTLGLTRYSEAEILNLLRRNNFSAERLEPNFGYNDARLAVVGAKRG